LLIGIATSAIATHANASNYGDLSRPVARGPQSDESVYFVVTDRFENGDTSNDQAGLTGGRLASGYEPSEPGWWHGGDLKGLTRRLSYIRNMGFTAIWITPPVKQRYFQGSSAGYHGYWGVDFTTVDPHLGTEADFKNMVDAAHKLGMKVIMDVVANHTADVIYYKLNATEYLDATKYPYKTASGKPFDPSKVAGLPTFPNLSAKYFISISSAWLHPLARMRKNLIG
jgi:glycosidase